MHPSDPKTEPATARQRLAASPDASDEVRLDRTKEFEEFGSDGRYGAYWLHPDGWYRLYAPTILDEEIPKT